MMQWVKDPALSLEWLGLLLWCWFHLWPGNFHMLWVQPKEIYIYIPVSEYKYIQVFRIYM